MKNVCYQVARYNTIAQNAQALNVNLNNSVLHRAKPEILRGIELLIDKMQSGISDLLVEVSSKINFVIVLLYSGGGGTGGWF